jgi:hypothetical protein
MRPAALVVVAAVALTVGTVIGYIRVDDSGRIVRIADPKLETPITRTSLRIAAFGSSQLPNVLPTVVRDVDDPRFAYAARIDRLTVTLPRGFTSVAYDLWPRAWNGRVMIFHNGHNQDLDYSSRVLRWFLARGWRVVSMAMPLAGQNVAPGFPREDGHDQLARLDHPLGVFLVPVVAVVNYSGADVMMGLSGGGWTTVVTTAVDPRIRRSYSVAGSIPWPWRCLPGRPGCAADLEQRIIPSYMRLYEFGSDPPRRQMALYNLDDPCCFGGLSSRVWAPRVRGNFRAIVDTSSNRHEVTRFHLHAITNDLSRDGPPAHAAVVRGDHFGAGRHSGSTR